MTRAERVKQVLRHHETDLIPFHADFTEQEFVKLGEDQQKNFLENNYLHSNHYCGRPAENPQMPGHFRDDFGVNWNRTGVDKDIGVIDRPIIAEPDITLWKTPVYNEARLRAELDELVRARDDKFIFAGIGFSMFERAWSLCGMENILVDMIVEPIFTEALLNHICDFNLRVMDIALQYPIDGFYFGDDWGQQSGLIMGPAHWRKYIKPQMKKMYDRAKSKGLYIIQHSCGDIYELFPDLIEIGLDCYQTFQPEIYDIEKVKHEYGKDLSFWGGISTQRLLPFAAPEEVKKETIKIMKIMSKGGGYIAGPTHAVPQDVPVENIAAMYDVFLHQEKYL